MIDNTVDRTILVCPPTKRSIRKIPKNVGNNRFKWVYLGEDVANAIVVEKSIDKSGERIDIAEILQETACTLRQPYIDYIGKLSVEYNSMLWWAGSLSEKNPFISKTFLYSCYVKVAISLLESHKQDDLILFVENRALRSSLVKNISEILGCEVVHLEPKFSHVLESLTDNMEFIIKHGWFVINNIYRIVLTQHIYHLNKTDLFCEKGNSNNDLILLHTWIDHRSFSQDNTFHDVYFGKLSNYMTKQMKNMAVVPYILHTVSYKKTIKKLINCEKQILIPSAYLKLSDILHVFKATMKKPHKKVYPHFKDIDISSLIYIDNLNDWKDARMSSNLLLYHVVKNWKKRGIPIERFIHTFENHMWEKIYCTAFREYYPLATLVGYQHAAISKMYLNYFISDNEHAIIPFPDKVITNGEYSTNLLLNSGYDSTKLIRGGAIRYEYLIEKLKQPAQKKIEKHTRSMNILVTSSIDKNESVELIIKVLKAFESNDMYNIIIKCHPVMPYQQIANELGITSLPAHFTVSMDTMGALLGNCDLLLYTSSTTCIEALAAEVPILHVGSNFIIDRDVLDSMSNLHSSAKTVEDIRIEVSKLRVMDSDELYKKNMISKDTAKSTFGEVNDLVYDMFL